MQMTETQGYRQFYFYIFLINIPPVIPLELSRDATDYELITCISIVVQNSSCVKVVFITPETWDFQSTVQFEKETLSGNQMSNNQSFYDLLLKSLHSTLGHNFEIVKSYEVISRSRISGECYVILMHELDTTEGQNFIRNVLGSLKNGSSWNSRARFVVLVSSVALAEVVLTEVWLNKLMNVVLLAVNNSEVAAYTWFPYRSAERCGRKPETVKIDEFKFNDSRFLGGRDLFPEKDPRRLHNCTVIVSTFPWPPFIINNANSSSLGDEDGVYIADGEYFQNGLEVKLFNLISSKLQFAVKYRIQSVKKWGGIITDITEGKSEIGFGEILNGGNHDNSLEITVSYKRSVVTWFVPSGRLVATWKNLFRAFDGTFWLLVIISCFLCGLLMELLARRSGETRFHAWEGAFAALINLSVSTSPDLWPLRTLFLFYVLYCMQVNTAYQSALMSNLANPGLEKPLTSLEELLDSPLDIGSYDVWFSMMAGIDDWRFQAVVSRLSACNEGDACLDKVAFSDNFAFVCSKLYAEYVTPKRYTTGKRKLVTALDDVVWNVDVVMYIAKDSLLLGSFNRIIRRAVESGFVAKWWGDLTGSDAADARVGQGEGEGEDGGATTLTLALEHLQGAFWLLMLGEAIGTVAFVLEHAMKAGIKRNI